MNNKFTLKKSVLSIIIVSAATGGLIALDKQQPLLPLPGNDAVKQLVLESDSNSVDLQEAELIALAENRIELVESESMVSEATGETFFLAAPEIQADDSLASDNSDEIQAAAIPVTEQQVPEVVPVKEVPEIDLQLLFAFDSSEIDESYKIPLSETAQQLMQAGLDITQKWQVIGYADADGDASYNQNLAYKRAQTVADFLISKGVDKERLEVISLGESRVEMANYADKAQQRRVEILPYQAEMAALAEQLNSLTRKSSAEQQAQPKSSDLADAALFSSAVEF